MLTHELISSEWNQDYPKYENFSKEFSKLSEITLEIENKYNKYFFVFKKKKWIP